MGDECVNAWAAHVLRAARVIRVKGALQQPAVDRVNAMLWLNLLCSGSGT